MTPLFIKIAIVLFVYAVKEIIGIQLLLMKIRKIGVHKSK